jgi:hypothetical protein
MAKKRSKWQVPGAACTLRDPQKPKLAKIYALSHGWETPVNGDKAQHDGDQGNDGEEHAHIGADTGNRDVQESPSKFEISLLR